MADAPLERRASLPGNGFTLEDWKDLAADPSELTEAQDQYYAWAKGLAAKLVQRALESHNAELHPTASVENMTSGVNKLQGCIFVGHTNTDCDSVASAVGAAHLFEGTAARAEVKVNGEIEFAAEYAGYKAWAEVSKGEALPPYFNDIPGAADPYNAGVGLCMVDCNAPEQMVPQVGPIAFPAVAPQGTQVDVKASQAMRCRLKGIIDHHAVSEHLATAGPIFVDIRPWGSACSIITHMYIRHGKVVPVPVARLLLCGILSDTVNLTSPTTTEADRMMCTLLVFFAQEEHVNELAKRMFRAKTAYLTQLSPFDMVRADQKNFTFDGKRVGFAVLEVNEPEKILSKASEVIIELRLLKKDKQLDFVFLAVVDLSRHRSDLILCGATELQLAIQAYKGPLSAAGPSLSEEEAWYGHNHTHACTHDDHTHGEAHKTPTEVFLLQRTKMDLGGRISRKLDFIPPLATVLTGGWQPDTQAIAEAQTEATPEVATSHTCTDQGCTIQRQYSFVRRTEAKESS